MQRPSTAFVGLAPLQEQRTKSVEEVILVRRALGAIEQQKARKIKSFSRPSTVGEQRKVKAAPIEMAARASVHPMQGTVLTKHPSGGGSAQVIARASADTSKSVAPTPLMEGVFHGQRSPEGKPSTSPGMKRAVILRHSDEIQRPVTHHATRRIDAGGDSKVEALGAKLDALAARLQNVDARSQVIGHVLRGEHSSLSVGMAEQDESARAWAHRSMSGDELSQSLPVGGIQRFGVHRELSDGHSSTANVPQRRVPNSITTAVDNIQSTLMSLDYIFVRATKDQHEAATRITKIARGYICRKRYIAGMVALRAWRERQSSGMVEFFNNWLVDRRHIHAQLKALTRKREVLSGRKCLMLWAELTWAVLPKRVDQRQRAYFMAVRVERRIVLARLKGWISVVRALKGRKEVAQRNMDRYWMIRDKVEMEAEQHGWRQELMESVIREEMSEEAVKVMTKRRVQLALKQYYKSWQRFYKKSLKKSAGQIKAEQHHVTMLGKRSYQAWRIYIEECKRWDSGRYVRLRNERQLQLQVIQATLKKAFSAWGFRASKCAEARRRFKRCMLQWLAVVSKAWVEAGTRQRRIKTMCLERWILISRSKTQLPFRRWYLWCADGKARRHAQEFISVMLAKRWAKLKIARMVQGWWEQTEQGADVGRGREELLTLLSEQQQINRAHEDTIARYKDLHNKSEQNLRKHEEILQKREKQMHKIEKERSELTMKLHSVEQELHRLKDMQQKGLTEAMLRKGKQHEANMIASTQTDVTGDLPVKPPTPEPYKSPPKPRISTTTTLFPPAEPPPPPKATPAQPPPPQAPTPTPVEVPRPESRSSAAASVKADTPPPISVQSEGSAQPSQEPPRIPTPQPHVETLPPQAVSTAPSRQPSAPAVEAPVSKPPERVEPPIEAAPAAAAAPESTRVVPHKAPPAPVAAPSPVKPPTPAPSAGTGTPAPLSPTRTILPGPAQAVPASPAQRPQSTTPTPSVHEQRLPSSVQPPPLEAAQAKPSLSQPERPPSQGLPPPTPKLQSAASSSSGSVPSQTQRPSTSPAPPLPLHTLPDRHHHHAAQHAEMLSRGVSPMPLPRPDVADVLVAPAPLPRIPGFTPSQTPDSIASARTPLPPNPTPPARRRAASVRLGVGDLEVPLADELLLQRSKHLIRHLHTLLDTGSVPPSSAKLVPALLELLEKGTDKGVPVSIAGASLCIDAPPLQQAPRKLEVATTNLDNLSWNSLIVGLDRYDARKKRQTADKGGMASGRDLLMNRILESRERKGRVLYDQASENESSRSLSGKKGAKDTLKPDNQNLASISRR